MIATARRSSPVLLAGRLMLGAFVGKVLGFAREIEIARLLGANYIADSFRASITATQLPIATMLGDIVPSVLIPLHREWSRNGSAPRRFTLLTTLFGLAAMPIFLAVWIFADTWVRILVGGFGPEAHRLTVQFVHVMALSMPVAVLANCFSCIEISLGRARIATIRSSVQNVAVMGGVALLATTGHVILIAWAFTLSMTATALYGGIMLTLERELTFHNATLAETWDVAVDFARRVRFLLVQPLADQCNILLERFLLSGIGVGTLASIDYARTLSETATFLISQPIGSVILAQHAGDRETSRARAEMLLRPLLALALPAAVFIFIFSPDIVTLVLKRGAFQAHAVSLTSSALRGIAVGLWATTIGWILIRMLNAAGRNRIAAMVLLCAAAGQAVVNLSTIRHFGVIGAGFGESTRGILMLVGAASSLRVGTIFLRLLLTMMIPTIGSLALDAAILHFIRSPTERLGLGGALFLVAGAGSLLLLAPDFIKGLWDRIRARRNLAPST